MLAIEVQNLTKTYLSHKRAPGVKGAIVSLFKREKHEVEAVRDVSFTVEEGELVGFLGPNGAGKTTTLKMLSGIIFPTHGKATVLGHVPWERKQAMQRQIALVMGQKMQLWWDLPAYESYLLLKALYEVPDDLFEKRLHSLAEMLGIEKLLNTQVRRLSLGERMKCELLAALIHSPRVLFLDEPTLGLDLVSQKRIREFLKEYNEREKTTILLTSHYMQDVRALAQRVLIIDHGQVIFDDTLRALSDRFSASKLLKLRFDELPDRNSLERYGQVMSYEGLEVSLEVPREQVSRVAADVLNRFSVADITIDEVDVEEVIRDIFAGNTAQPIAAAASETP
ncbi:MAG: ATP-binding cassette domain-containing protein [Fimbriimonadia bacterium]|nr:ATP-binding cassette domain-containing protein [Fimbriimonadia bacterium]